MRNLLQDADRDRLVAPLAATLAGEVQLRGHAHRALAEAEGGALFAGEGNARAAELLMLPGVRDTHAELGDAVLDFVMAMADAPQPCRHAAAGGIELLRDDPRDLELRTPFHRLWGDLTHGTLHQERRGGPRGVVRHGGNLVEFRMGRFRNCVDVEDAIVETAVERDGDTVRLRHASVIVGEGGLALKRKAEAGRLTITYEIRAGTPVIEVVASFTASRPLSRLRVTTALDALDEGGLGATAGRLLEGASWRDIAPSPLPGTTKWTDGTPVDHLAIGAADWPSHGPVLHIRPHEPGRIMSVTAEARRAGALHWLVLRHGPVELKAGETLTVRERRLLAQGNDVGSTAGAMDLAATGLDLDPVAHSGAALHAVAAALLFDASRPERMPEARRTALLGFVERQLARLEASEVATLDLADAAVAADSLRRLRGAVAEPQHAALVGQLAGRLDSGGVLRGPREAPTLAAQAIGILAFARAAAWLEGGRAAGALAASLGAIAVAPDGSLVFNGVPIEPRREAVGIALLMRAAGAAVLAGEAGATLPPTLLDRARLLHRTGVNLLRPLIQPRMGRLEIAGPGGISPALQAAATLALLAPERLVLGARAAANPAAA